MRLLLGEIFEEIANAKEDEKKQLLLKYNHPIVCEILKLNFNSNIKFLLPEGTVPYKVNDAPAGMAGTNLWIEFRKMYLFMEHGHTLLKQSRREELFIQLLEGLYSKDANLLIQIKDKKLPVSRTVVDAAFPGLLEPEVNKIENLTTKESKTEEVAVVKPNVVAAPKKTKKSKKKKEVEDKQIV